MSLHRIRLLLLGLSSVALLSACGGGGGSSAPAPQNVVVTPGDTQVTLTWDMQPGVEYWLWYKDGNSVTIGGTTTFKIEGFTSPYVLSTPALLNGTTYAFTINARTNKGPGGPGSPVVLATPGLAGANWFANGSLGSADMRGLAYGLTPGSSTTHTYVAVGDAGSLYQSPAYTSTAPLAWTATPATGTPLAGVDLKATLYTLGKYIVVGAGGTIASSTDLVTWTAGTSTGTARLNALASNGSTVVAVGAGGSILRSTDGIAWSPATSVPTGKELLGVAWSSAGVWVAVGAQGTLLTSLDADTWVTAAAGTAQDLKGVSAVASTLNSVTTYTLVAVGANGAVSTSSTTTSTDVGLTWSAQTLAGSPDLNAVFAATRIVAVGANGALYTSEDGTTWTSRSSPGNFTMYGLIRADNVFTALGAAGRSIYSY